MCNEFTYFSSVSGFPGYRYFLVGSVEKGDPYLVTTTMSLWQRFVLGLNCCPAAVPIRNVGWPSTINLPGYEVLSLLLAWCSQQGEDGVVGGSIMAGKACSDSALCAGTFNGGYL